jgi:pterin-4a-carbinolamine dehydratase
MRMEEKSMAGWRDDGEALTRDLEFEDFAAAMAYVNRVADLEHDDRDMARRIDELT